eukprot:SM000004S15001  [mRNA]  locus=s4:701484:704966:+ [translate_table: standard]
MCGLRLQGSQMGQREPGHLRLHPMLGDTQEPWRAHLKATLDTWLPEQVAFIESMGNMKANKYWEALLPPGFRRPAETDRDGLEAFIRQKYELRRWVADQNNKKAARDSEGGQSERSRRPYKDEQDFGESRERDGCRVYGSNGGITRNEYEEHKLRRERREKESGGAAAEEKDKDRARTTTSTSADAARRPGRPTEGSAPSRPSPTVNGVPARTSRLAQKTPIVLKVPAIRAVPKNADAPATPPLPLPVTTDLFDLLGLDDPPTPASGASLSTSQTVQPGSSANDQGWAAFPGMDTQAAHAPTSASSTEPTPSIAGGDAPSTKPAEAEQPNFAAFPPMSTSNELEDLFAISPAVNNANAGQASSSSQSKDVKKEDILSLFEKPSPLVARQQMAMMLQQQQMLMAAAAAAAARGGMAGAAGPAMISANLAGSSQNADSASAPSSMANGVDLQSEIFGQQNSSSSMPSALQGQLEMLMTMSKSSMLVQPSSSQQPGSAFMSPLSGLGSAMHRATSLSNSAVPGASATAGSFNFDDMVSAKPQGASVESAGAAKAAVDGAAFDFSSLTADAFTK